MKRSADIYVYFALACAITWLLALPAALAWLRHQTPSPGAVACAGLSAFGPLLAALAVAGPQRRLRELFGRWRTHPAWIAVALLAAPFLHALATSLYAAVGGHPTEWFHPPVTAESLAALVVFPLGEEFGWRGFAHPRLVARFGAVRGSLILGAVWGLWHLVYAITPQAGAFDPFVFGMTMIELPLYALVIASLFERSGRSMAVAIAFHAGAHIDHIERAPRAELGLHAAHLLILLVAAFLAARALRARARAPQRGYGKSAVGAVGSTS
ncbi:MAG TPA: CPBP family intramembrane glutamic endopeptidase [Polyangia bacterium]